MDLERDALPLLFFQRGYGRFSTGPLLLANERDVFQSVRLAEAARDEIEAVAQELSLGCSVVTSAGADSIYVAIADHSHSQRGKNRLGNRAPLVPPLGALFVGNSNAISDELWFSRLGKSRDEAVARAKEQLARVRQRGWSISLLGELSSEELDTAIELYSCPHRTPEQERRFLSTVETMFDMHEPEQVDDEQNYDVLHLSVPVKRSNGDTALVLRLSELPPQLSGAQISRLLERLQAAAMNVEAIIAHIPD